MENIDGLFLFIGSWGFIWFYFMVFPFYWHHYHVTHWRHYHVTHWRHYHVTHWHHYHVTHWRHYVFPIESVFKYSHQLNRNESSNGFYILRSHFKFTYSVAFSTNQKRHIFFHKKSSQNVKLFSETSFDL